MGSGKSLAAIKFMNDNKNKRFIYITPYLDEATRIKQNCPLLCFIEPKKTLEEFNYSKTEHTRYLLSIGRNISTTHKAFRLYTSEMLDLIKKHKYTLIVDEAVEVFEDAEYSVGDVQMLIDSNHVEFNDGRYVFTGKEYTGTRFKELFGMLKCNNLVPVEESDKKKYLYYWMLPKDVLFAFQDVYVMTYMFDAQDLKYYMDIHKIEYKKIGITKNAQGEYLLSDDVCSFPSHVMKFKDKIHILENAKLNSIGARIHDLSANWFKRRANNTVDVLKNNLYNFFRNYNKEVPSNRLMWTTFKKNIRAIQGKGYTKKFISYNEKATNKYKDNYVLAYCANVYVKPVKIRFFANHDITYDEDLYALSTLVQWIWRSAIRNGEEIWLYIPSKRMRDLLKNWMESL